MSEARSRRVGGAQGGALPEQADGRKMYLITDPVAEIPGAGVWVKAKSSGTSNHSSDWAGRRQDGKEG